MTCFQLVVTSLWQKLVRDAQREIASESTKFIIHFAKWNDSYMARWSWLSVLQQDGDYIRMLASLREAQATVDRLQATLDDAIDQRRADDRRSRDRLSAALEHLAAHAAASPTEAVIDSIRIEPHTA